MLCNALHVHLIYELPHKFQEGNFWVSSVTSVILSSGSGSAFSQNLDWVDSQSERDRKRLSQAWDWLNRTVAEICKSWSPSWVLKTQLISKHAFVDLAQLNTTHPRFLFEGFNSKSLPIPYSSLMLNLGRWPKWLNPKSQVPSLAKFRPWPIQTGKPYPIRRHFCSALRSDCHGLQRWGQTWRPRRLHLLVAGRLVLWRCWSGCEHWIRVKFWRGQVKSC